MNVYWYSVYELPANAHFNKIDLIVENNILKKYITQDLTNYIQYILRLLYKGLPRSNKREVLNINLTLNKRPWVRLTNRLFMLHLEFIAFNITDKHPLN